MIFEVIIIASQFDLEEVKVFNINMIRTVSVSRLNVFLIQVNERPAIFLNCTGYIVLNIE